MTAETYERLALEETDQHWELHRGRLREKPSGTYLHNHVTCELGFSLADQLDWQIFHARINAGRLRHAEDTYYIPDVFAFPFELARDLLDRWDVLEVYAEPVPLVAEVWSSFPADYRVDEKLPTYRARGDLEIWRLHPYERTLTAWRRQPDGTYAETVYRGGAVQPVALAGVTIDLDALFEVE